MNDGTNPPARPGKLGETAEALLTLAILFQLFVIVVSIAGYRPSPLVGRLHGMFAGYLRPLALDIDSETGFHLTRDALLDGTPQITASWVDAAGETQVETISGASGPGLQGRLRRGRLAASAVVNTVDESVQSLVPLSVVDSLLAGADVARVEVRCSLRAPASLEALASADAAFRDPASNVYLEELYAAVARRFEGDWSAAKLESRDEAAPPSAEAAN